MATESAGLQTEHQVARVPATHSLCILMSVTNHLTFLPKSAPSAVLCLLLRRRQDHVPVGSTKSEGGNRSRCLSTDANQYQHIAITTMRPPENIGKRVTKDPLTASLQAVALVMKIAAKSLQSSQVNGSLSKPFQRAEW